MGRKSKASSVISGRDSHLITTRNWRAAVDKDDRGTEEAIRHRTIERISTKIDGAEVTVNRAVSVLRDLRLKGAINDDQYRLGLVFEDAFDRGHLEALKASEFLRGGDSSWRANDVPLPAVRGRDHVFGVLAMVGGSGSVMACALYNIVGLRLNFKELGIKTGRDRKEWRGILIAALEMLVEDERRHSKKRP